MIRRFNYTKRERIPRKDIEIVLYSEDGKIWFDANLSKLNTLGLPDGSAIFIEAYRQTNWKRFDFGEIGSIKPAENRDLSLFETHEGVLFRVKVTDPDRGRLIAEADKIPFLLPGEEEASLEPLLKIRPQNLGNEVYRVDYSDDRVGPILEINSLLGNYQQIGRAPAFVSLVYPAVLREILGRILLLENYFETTDRSDWRSRWLIFAESFPGTGGIPSEKDDREQREDWIDKVVAAFCKRQKIVEKFFEFWSDES